MPLYAGKTAKNAKTTAYVCRERTCLLPTNDPKLFQAELAKFEPLLPTRPARLR